MRADGWATREIMGRWAHVSRSTRRAHYLVSVTDETRGEKLAAEVTWRDLEQLGGFISRERRRLAEEGTAAYG